MLGRRWAVSANRPGLRCTARALVKPDLRVCHWRVHAVDVDPPLPEGRDALNLNDEASLVPYLPPA